jgi:hypothetical protein
MERETPLRERLEDAQTLMLELQGLCGAVNSLVTVLLHSSRWNDPAFQAILARDTAEAEAQLERFGRTVVKIIARAKES